VIEWQARRDNERMRPMPRRALYPAACLPILLLLGACAAAWPERPPLTLDQQRAAVVPDMPDVRFWSDETPAEMTKIRSRLTRERRGTATEGLPLTLLALSSGSDNAAYAAGVLEGWTRSGTRPDFTVVTGVSAGALTAPFAFLGSDHDARLRRLYTTITQKDVFARRGVSGLVSGPSLVDTRPLRTLIAANIDAALVDRIAAQHKRGRRLYIMTTNLDAGRGVVWDMGAIAASGSPRRLDLFRDILLASASVPGAFTPVLIPAQCDDLGILRGSGCSLVDGRRCAAGRRDLPDRQRKARARLRSGQAALLLDPRSCADDRALFAGPAIDHRHL
jgi:hypothetical protein